MSQFADRIVCISLLLLLPLLLCRLLKQDVSAAQGVIAGDPNEPQQAMPFFTDELRQVRL
jgi:hypothetical protein